MFEVERDVSGREETTFEEDSSGITSVGESSFVSLLFLLLLHVVGTTVVVVGEEGRREGSVWGTCVGSGREVTNTSLESFMSSLSTTTGGELSSFRYSISIVVVGP